MKIARIINNVAYRATFWLLSFMHPVLRLWRKSRLTTQSVIHVSYAVHIGTQNAEQLRKLGYHAEHLAIGSSKTWNGQNTTYSRPSFGPLVAWAEFRWFWGYLSRFEVIHSHFGLLPSSSGWEVAQAAAMGRTLVLHHRGCTSRNQAINEKLHPNPLHNICLDCDYSGKTCRSPIHHARLAAFKRAQALELVTTPDLRDFHPKALHLPFYAPPLTQRKSAPFRLGETLRIVQVTNHPGIEGVRYIREAVEKLQRAGRSLTYEVISESAHAQALEALASAHVTIGKMKMGYYANSQVESLALGVPAITWIREADLPSGLAESALILSDLADLEKTLLNIMDDPAFLESKSKLCHATIQRFHNNLAIAKSLAGFYGWGAKAGTMPAFHARSNNGQPPDLETKP